MRTTVLILAVVAPLTLIPALACAGDGPVVTLNGTGITAIESSDPELVADPAVVEAGSDVQYCWTAQPGVFASPIASYRTGWNVVDPNDPDDPGWGPVTAFDGSESCSNILVFEQGAPSFVLEVTDEADVGSRIVLPIQIIQAVEESTQSWSALKSRFSASQ